MKTYHVVITRYAFQKIARIHQYISTILLAPLAAERMKEKLISAIEQLALTPAKYRLVPFEPERSRGLRRMNVGKYAVFYKIDDDTVTVIDILYASSDIE